MVVYTPSEDTRYAFAIGRVRSREARMLTRQQFERLVESRNEAQMISALADTHYAETRAEDINTMLARAAAEEEAFFRRYLEEEPVGDFFLAPDLGSNLKFALRRKYGGELDDSLFISQGSPSIEEFAKLLEGESATVPDWLREAAGKVAAASVERVDPASIDLAVDRALIEHQYQLTRGYSFLGALLSIEVDLTNLLTLLRLRVAEEQWEEFEKAFLPYGTVPLERFKVWWAEREVFQSKILEVDLYKGLSDGLREVRESFVLLERQMKEKELGFLLSARRLVFGYEPLVSYALLKREERRNIRRVATGLRYGLERETVRRSIAWFD